MTQNFDRSCLRMLYSWMVIAVVVMVSPLSANADEVAAPIKPSLPVLVQSTFNISNDEQDALILYQYDSGGNRTYLRVKKPRIVIVPIDGFTLINIDP